MQKMRCFSCFFFSPLPRGVDVSSGRFRMYGCIYGVVVSSVFPFPYLFFFFFSLVVLFNCIKLCNPRIIPRDKGERGKNFLDDYFLMWYRCCCRAALHVSGTRGFRGRVHVGCCGLGNKLPSDYSDCNITMSSALHALIANLKA